MKLTEALLSEVSSKPKAIFMAGPAGAGKSFILDKLDLDKFTTINVDDTYEELLRAEFGQEIDFSKMSPDQLSQAGKFMAQARKATDNKLASAKEMFDDIIIDGTGAAPNPLLKKKKDLEDLGYDTFMFALYVSPMTSLKRNNDRSRSLPTSAVLGSWAGIAGSVDQYAQEFGKNFVLIDNDPEGADTSFDPEAIKKAFPMPRGKDKSPEEIEKSRKKKEELNNKIAGLLSKDRPAVSFEEAKTRLNQFLNL